MLQDMDNHPVMEEEKGIDKEHVIIDRKDFVDIARLEIRTEVRSYMCTVCPNSICMQSVVDVFSDKCTVTENPVPKCPRGLDDRTVWRGRDD